MAKMMYVFNKEELDKFTHDMVENLAVARDCIEGIKSDKPCHTPELKKKYLDNAHICIVEALELLNNLKK